MADGLRVRFALDVAQTEKRVYEITTAYMRISEATGEARIYFDPVDPYGEVATENKVVCICDGKPIGRIYLTWAAQPGTHVDIFTSEKTRVGY